MPMRRWWYFNPRHLENQMPSIIYLYLQLDLICSVALPWLSFSLRLAKVNEFHYIFSTAITCECILVVCGWWFAKPPTSCADLCSDPIKWSYQWASTQKNRLNRQLLRVISSTVCERADSDEKRRVDTFMHEHSTATHRTRKKCLNRKFTLIGLFQRIEGPTFGITRYWFYCPLRSLSSLRCNGFACAVSDNNKRQHLWFRSLVRVSHGCRSNEAAINTSHFFRVLLDWNKTKWGEYTRENCRDIENMRRSSSRYLTLETKYFTPEFRWLSCGERSTANEDC